jgi:chromosome segregation ATPase
MFPQLDMSWGELDDELIDADEDLVEELHQTIYTLQDDLKLKVSVLEEMEKELDEKELMIREKELMIREKDAENSCLSTSLAELHRQLCTAQFKLPPDSMPGSPRCRDPFSPAAEVDLLRYLL